MKYKLDLRKYKKSENVYVEAMRELPDFILAEDGKHYKKYDLVETDIPPEVLTKLKIQIDGKQRQFFNDPDEAIKLPIGFNKFPECVKLIPIKE